MQASSSKKTGRLLVWLGNPFFSVRLPDYGWRMVSARFESDQVHTWQSILELTGGEAPDVVVVGDTSSPPILTGMEEFPCLTVFYVVDSHIHSWYPVYAQGFDLVLVTLREHLPDFIKGRLHASRVWWTPPYARDQDRPPQPHPEPEWDLVFSGTVSKERAPKRYRFLMELKEAFPGLHITYDPFVRVYPKARLVLNETRGELNFRIFEVLGLGRCLLTPDSGPPLTDLFTHGKELILYPAHNVQAIIPLITGLLADDSRREQIAAAGLAAVDARHRAGIRAGEWSSRVEALFSSGEAGTIIEERKAASRYIATHFLRLLYLHHAETVGLESLRQAYLETAKQSRNML